MIQEANIGIQHAKATCVLDGVIKKLKTEDSINVTKIRFAKKHFDKLKADFPF